MNTVIKCDVCDWKKPDGWVLVWHFKRCPECRSEVITGADVALWVALYAINTIGRVILFFIPNAKAVFVRISSKDFTRRN